MKTLTYITILFLGLLMASCEDVIQVKLDKGPPMLTVDAFVNDLRQAQTIRLTYTDGYFSQKPNQGVAGASVKITDLSNGQVFLFNDNGNGDYILPINPGDTIGRVGHRYRLEVLHQGLTYSAETRMNRTTGIDSIKVEEKDSTTFSPVGGYKCSFLGIDPPGDTTDYYWVKSYKNGTFWGKGGQINLSENAGGGEGTDGLFFTPPVAEGVTPFDESYRKNDWCRIEIHSISRTTFDFLTQVQAQTTNSGLFATTPENVKSNIVSPTDKVKVVGWFNMAAVYWKERQVQ